MKLSRWSNFLILLTLIFFSVSCCSTKTVKLNLGNHPLEAEAAYYIQQRLYIDSPAEDIPDMELGGGSGSGFGIRRTLKHTDILTAGHVCEIPEALVALEPSREILLFNIYGEIFNGTIWAIDSENDLCLIRIDEKRPVLKLAKNNPALGDRVFSAGYPNAMYMPGLLHFFEGYFDGLDPNRNGYFSIPSSPGSSGSAIVDKRGRVVGIISAVLQDFHHATIGPTVESIQIFLLLSEHCDKFCIQ